MPISISAWSHQHAAFIDPTGHYNRPDVFQLLVDTRLRSAVHEANLGMATDVGPPTFDAEKPGSSARR